MPQLDAKTRNDLLRLLTLWAHHINDAEPHKHRMPETLKMKKFVKLMSDFGDPFSYNIFLQFMADPDIKKLVSNYNADELTVATDTAEEPEEPTDLAMDNEAPEEPMEPVAPAAPAPAPAPATAPTVDPEAEAQRFKQSNRDIVAQLAKRAGSRGRKS